jgi:hypothetical protein
MSVLREISVRAKWEGSFTEEWATLRRSITHESDLKDLPGGSPIQKLSSWAEGQGLLMDFDLSFEGFSSAIRTITFWNVDPEARNGAEVQSAAGDSSPPPAMAQALATTDAAQTAAAGTDSSAEAGGVVAAVEAGPAGVELECVVHEDFDWNSVESAPENDDEAWAALSREADYMLIGGICAETAHIEEPSHEEGPAHLENPVRAPESAHAEEPVHTEELVHLEEPVPAEPEDTSEAPARKHRRGVRARTTRKSRKSHQEELCCGLPGDRVEHGAELVR